MDTNKDHIERTVPSGDESQRSGPGILLNDLNSIGTDLGIAGVLYGLKVAADKFRKPPEPPPPAEVSRGGSDVPVPAA